MYISNLTRENIAQVIVVGEKNKPRTQGQRLGLSPVSASDCVTLASHLTSSHSRLPFVHEEKDVSFSQACSKGFVRLMNVKVLCKL